MKVCFFVRLFDPNLLRKMSFYADDIRILEELGHQVFPVTEISKIPFWCDLYFVWWYGWGALPLLLAKILNRPNVVAGAVHYEERRYGYFARPFYHRWMTRWSVRNADAVLAISRIELEGVKKIGATHPFLAYLCASNPAPVVGWSGRENLVFSIGHMNQKASIDRKGFDNVLRAIPLVARIVPDVRFVMAGTIGGEFYLDQLASSLDVSDRVMFPGQIDNETRSKYLSQARVLAQPAEFEGFGLAQLEAMVHGLPVVTSPAGAVPEVVGDTALYCDKNSPQQIADRIVELLSDRERWQRCSDEGYRRATQLFSYESRKQKIQEVLDSVVASYERPADRSAS